MSTAFSFQTQLVSILDVLSKTAVLEISKLVDIETKMLKVEITRGRNEIASLTEKLHLMEKLLCMTQGRSQDTTVCSDLDVSTEKDVFFVHSKPKSVIKSEIFWERSSSDAKHLHQEQENGAAKGSVPSLEQAELILVKEEPLEVEDRNTDQGCQIVTESQQIPEEAQHPEATAEHQQPLFTAGLGTQSTWQPLLDSGREEMEWNPLLTAARATVQDGQHIASQSLNALRNMKPQYPNKSSAKRFGCMQCGKCFRCFSQLEIHQRSHTGEKPFRCPLCGKRYAQKGHLYTHQRTHTGEKPYRCPICGKGFIQKCTLDMHQRTHTGEKPFVCASCGKGFTKKCNLTKHLTLHLDPLSMYGNSPEEPSISGTCMHKTM